MRWYVGINPDQNSPQQWVVRGPGRVYLRRTFSDAHALRASLEAAEAAIARLAQLQTVFSASRNPQH